MELKRYRVRLEGMDIADFDTYGEAYTFKNAYSGESVDIFDAVTENYIFPKFNVMNERGVIVNYADSEDTAKEFAEKYKRKTGIDAFVLDNSKDYTGPARCEQGAKI